MARSTSAALALAALLVATAAGCAPTRGRATSPAAATPGLSQAQLDELVRGSPAWPVLQQAPSTLTTFAQRMAEELGQDYEDLSPMTQALALHSDPQRLAGHLAGHLAQRLSPADLAHIYAWQRDPAQQALLRATRGAPPTTEAAAPPVDTAALVPAFMDQGTLRALWVSLYSNGALVALRLYGRDARDRALLQALVAGAVRATGVERASPQALRARLRAAFADADPEALGRFVAFWTSPQGARYKDALWGGVSAALSQAADDTIATFAQAPSGQGRLKR